MGGRGVRGNQIGGGDVVAGGIAVLICFCFFFFNDRLRFCDSDYCEQCACVMFATCALRERLARVEVLFRGMRFVAPLPPRLLHFLRPQRSGKEESLLCALAVVFQKIKIEVSTAFM